MNENPPRLAEVGPYGTGLKSVDLTPLLPPAWVDNYGGLTVAVVGRYAVVEVYSTNASQAQMDGIYFLVELVPPPRVGPGVQGAHFAG